MGVSVANIITGIALAAGVERRLKIIKGINGCTIIDDSYNANPEAMKASLEVLAARDGRKIFVAGGMAELGAMAEELHLEVGAFAKAIGVDYLLCCGGYSACYAKSFGANAQYFVAKDDLIAALHSLAVENTSILVKGSFSMGMDVVVNSLLVKERT
jgi:UDP-N-acetylmuramoyl-tripeptide--D-alanyl-D-alanine ligase